MNLRRCRVLCRTTRSIHAMPYPPAGVLVMALPILNVTYRCWAERSRFSRREGAEEEVARS
jgi:hypothetical protein